MTQQTLAVPERRAGDFWIFWTGQTISQIGSALTATALPLLVFKLSGSALDLGQLAATALSVGFSAPMRGARYTASASRAEALSGTARALLPLPARTRSMPPRSSKVISLKVRVAHSLRRTPICNKTYTMA